MKTFARLESVFIQAARLQRGGVLRRVLRLEGLAVNVARSALRRWRFRRRHGVAPAGIAFSPTMECNLACAGCYAAQYPRGEEVPLEVFDRMLGEAERIGVFLVVVTGGEPLLREGLVGLLARHRRLLFLLVTNGTLLDGVAAHALSGSRNIVPVISLDGPRDWNDARRGEGTYAAAVAAMDLLKKERALFGFSTMVTRDNWAAVVGDQFVVEMIERGCALGFYTEYMPVGEAARKDWILSRREQDLFRQELRRVRATKPLIAVHLPDDEYDERDRCMGVAWGSVHINAQGFIEPCPFAHFAADNIVETGLEEGLCSAFLRELRASDAISRRTHLGCALVENRAMLGDIAGRTGAKDTDTAGPRLPAASPGSSCPRDSGPASRSILPKAKRAGRS
ncbi:MAG: radical SAM protein [bacterium]